MAKISCPVCRRKFESETTKSPPFCSERCRLVDLKRWLSEEYAVPATSDPDSDPDEEAPGEPIPEEDS